MPGRLRAPLEPRRQPALLGRSFVVKVLDIKLETNMNTLSLGTIFPIVFTISQSYKRREEALQRLASLKANAYGLYWIQRDWDPSRTNGAKIAAAVSHMFDSIRVFLHADTYDRQEALKGVYASMSACSLVTFELTNNPATDSRPQCAPTHASRANQYIRYCINDFERMRVIRDYRTPEGLRLFATFLLHILPVILGPRFAQYCAADEDNYGCASSYFTAIMFFVVVLTLYHVQQDLEDPYDESGWDDIKLELTPEVQFLMSLHPDPKLLKHPGISPEVVARMERASNWQSRSQVTLPAESAQPEI
mmetsp:Transcript_53343/g.169577  ORF Transcript_53343/g.169577 Transcript_53343/m.169577 type:complete len:306 (+) Transcript_53343:332-1249(+)